MGKSVHFSNFYGFRRCYSSYQVKLARVSFFIKQFMKIGMELMGKLIVNKLMVHNSITEFYFLLVWIIPAITIADPRY